MIRNKLKVLLNIPILGALWSFTKHAFKLSHKGLTAVKAITYFIRWNIEKKKKLYTHLKSNMMVTNIKPYHPLHWKHGVTYFTGDINGVTVFIKTSGVINTIMQEKYAIDYSRSESEILREHIPEIIAADEDVIVEERIIGRPLSAIKETAETEQYNIVQQLYEIFSELRRINVLHLDIRPENFILQNDGTLILIDFGYSLVSTTELYRNIPKTKEVQRIILNLGSNYSPGNGTLDDAYSFLLTMKYVSPELMQKHPSVWQELNEESGKNLVKITNY